MAESIDPDFEISLVIALRRMGQSTRVSYAGKHPHQRDTGADQIAKVVMEQLRRSGWEISHPVVPLPLCRTLV